MNVLLQERVRKEADYMLTTGKTVREIAKYFQVSKSTVHKDLHERLQILDARLFEQVDEIMKYHLHIRHIRGGESTKKKYQKIGKNM